MTPPLTLRRILTLGIFSSNPSKCCQKLKRNNWIFPPSVSQNTKWQCVNWQAYKNHWVLRTKPDDWFFPVIRRIAQVVDDNALHPEVMAYLGRGKPKSELRVNFNKGFEKMFEELSLQISRNLVTSEYAKVNRVGQGMSTFPLKHRTQTLYLLLDSPPHLRDFAKNHIFGNFPYSMSHQFEVYQSVIFFGSNFF